MVHVMKFFDHIKDRDGRAELFPLSQPKKQWSSPLIAFKEAYQHEQLITSRINALVRIADEENDHRARTLLRWFTTEQVEEEASTSKVAAMLERIGDSGSGLVMLDAKLCKTLSHPVRLQIINHLKGERSPWVSFFLLWG